MTEKLTTWIQTQPLNSKGDVELSIIIPAYNEKWRLPSTLIDIVDYFDSSPISYEVIVVDDGSSDDTSDIVRKFEKVREQFRLIRLPQNEGKGSAVRFGAMNAKGNEILFLDADGATPIQELERLRAALKKNNDIAIGSRAMMSEDTNIKTIWYRKLLGRIFNNCVNIILLPGIKDTQCGFKIFKKDAAHKVFSKQTSKGFSFDVEILFLARKMNLKIIEVPINWENVPGSKINLLLDSTKMLLDIIKFKFIHRNVTDSTA